MRGKMKRTEKKINTPPHQRFLFYIALIKTIKKKTNLKIKALSNQTQLFPQL